jgi:hypothetical protein
MTDPNGNPARNDGQERAAELEARVAKLTDAHADDQATIARLERQIGASEARGRRRRRG